MAHYIQHEAASAQLDWDTAQENMGNGRWHAAIGRFYYAAFHATTAFLMAQTGRKAKTHKGHGALVGQLKEKTPALYAAGQFGNLGRLQHLREQADYLRPAGITQQEAETARRLAEPMVKTCLEHPLVANARTNPNRKKDRSPTPGIG